MTATKIDDHAARALARLPNQHQESPRLLSLLSTLAESAQEVEDGVYPLLTDRAIDAAIGEQLDIIGRIVLQPRLGLGDDDYRLMLRARIAANRSSGSVSQLIGVAVLVLLPSVGLVVVTQYPPAGVQVDVRDLSVDSAAADTLFDLLSDSVAGGVRLLLITSASEDDDVLYTSLSAYVRIPVSSGSGVVPVDDASKFPQSGQVDLATGTAVEETVTFVSRTNSVLTLSGTTANAHVVNADVSLVGSRGLGLGNTDAPTEGGDISSVEGN